MINYSCALNLNWQLYFDNHEAYPQMELLYGALNEFYPLFESYLSIDTSRRLAIVNPTITGPVYFKDSELIFLSVEHGERIPQFLFQLAHELCHFAISPHIESENLKWFEEVLCDCASLFFLYIVAERYTQASNALADAYTCYFRDSINGPAMEKFTLTPDIDFAKLDRPKLHFLACSFFPIFLKDPLLWKELKRLPKDSTNLADLLDRWIVDGSLSRRSALLSIKGLFFPPL